MEAIQLGEPHHRGNSTLHAAHALPRSSTNIGLNSILQALVYRLKGVIVPNRVSNCSFIMGYTWESTNCSCPGVDIEQMRCQ